MIKWHSLDGFPTLKKEFEKRDKIEFQKSMQLLEEVDEDEPENKIMIIKGDVSRMKNLDVEIEKFIGEKVEKEFYELEENLSETNKKALAEAFATLNEFKEEIKEDPKLKKALLTLARFVGYGAGYPKPYPQKYPYPPKVKKSDGFYWPTAERQIYGYNQDDLTMIKNSEIDEIEKSSDSNPFPSLASIFSQNKEALEKAFELATVEERAI